MHQDWLATVSKDLQGKEGFGLVATSRDPSATDIAAIADRIPAFLGWALQWNFPSSSESPNPLPNGAMFKCSHQGLQVLGWKIGGFRDQRGREGAIAAQLFEFEQGERCEPELLARVAGTSLLPRDHAKVGLRDSPLPTLTPEEFSATARQPSVALATDGELHNQIGNTIEALVSGQRQVVVRYPDVDLFWEGFWSIIPQSAGAEISASTAGSDQGHTEFKLIIQQGEADPAGRSELTDFVYAALFSYANGHERAQIPELETLADFVGWVRQQEFLTYMGRPYLSSADYVQAVADAPAGHATVDQSGLYRALCDPAVPQDLRASVTEALARSSEPQVFNAVAAFAAQHNDVRLAALLLGEGHRDAALQLAKAKWSRIGQELVNAGVSEGDVLDIRRDTVAEASTEDLCRAVEDHSLDRQTRAMALRELGTRAWGGDADAADLLLLCAATPSSGAEEEVIAELRGRRPTTIDASVQRHAVKSRTLDAWLDDGKWERLVREKRLEFAKAKAAEILRIPEHELILEIREKRIDPMTGQQGTSPLTASNRRRKSKSGTRAMGLLRLAILLLTFVFALIVGSRLGLLSGGSGEDVPSQDPEPTVSISTTSVEPESGSDEPVPTGENGDSQQENEPTESSTTTTSEGTDSGSAEDPSTGGDG